jgi:hypothetical protein
MGVAIGCRCGHESHAFDPMWDLSLPIPARYRDWAHPCIICAATGAHPCIICAGTGAHPCIISAGTGLANAAAAPRRGGTCSEVSVPAQKFRYLLRSFGTCSEVSVPSRKFRHLLRSFGTCSEVSVPARKFLLGATAAGTTAASRRPRGGRRRRALRWRCSPRRAKLTLRIARTCAEAASRFTQLGLSHLQRG